MKSVNQYGLYQHLNEIDSNNDIDYDLTRSSMPTKDTFDENINENYFSKLYEHTP